MRQRLKGVLLWALLGLLAGLLWASSRWWLLLLLLWALAIGQGR